MTDIAQTVEQIAEARFTLFGETLPSDVMEFIRELAAKLEAAERDRDRAERMLEAATDDLERAMESIPMFPITMETAEAVENGVMGVSFVLGALRIRNDPFVLAGEAYTREQAAIAAIDAANQGESNDRR